MYMPTKVFTYATFSLSELYKRFASRETGLSSYEAQKRQNIHGKNSITSQKNSWIKILKRQFASPFMYLLIAAAFVSVGLGEYIDGSIIILFITINSGLGFFQEFRSEKTMRLLKNYIQRTAVIWRDSKEQTVAVDELVPGDIICLTPGQIIPADVRFIEGDSIVIDESILTGESRVVSKSARVMVSAPRELFQAKNIGFSGTSIVSGIAKAMVLATGNETSFGSIAALTQEVKRVSSFQKRIDIISRFTLILVSVSLCVFFVAHIVLGTTSSFIQLAVFCIALAISVIPEGLPVVTTFALSIGAKFLAKKHVVVKRLSAIEDLGSIEVLCSDKTGTLTENVLTVTDVFSHHTDWFMNVLHAISSHAVGGSYQGNNSFDEAILRKTKSMNQKLTMQVVSELPFDPKRKRTTKIIADHSYHFVVSMGSPEIIMAMCHKTSHADFLSLQKQIAGWGKDGKRVLVVASKKIEGIPRHITESEHNLHVLGAIAFEDPIKPTTKEAIHKAKSLGLQVKIITGDSKEVAGHVGYEIGLIQDPADVVTGDVFMNMSLPEQLAAVDSYNVFARVSPEEKYHILELLERSKVVGYLGEGINDAPAIKTASVGIVVTHASDIAREAADIVLMKKSLLVIVDGIKEGRQIYANITKYILATLSANFGNFFAVASSALIIKRLPLMAIHILLLNLLSDFPMLAVATDKVDAEEIDKPTHFNMHHFALLSLLLGLVSTFFDFVFFGVFVGKGSGQLQTAWFIGSILTELLFLFSIRTNKFMFRASRPSKILLALTGFAVFTTLIIPNLQITRELFHFSLLPAGDLAIVFAIIILYGIATEGVKLLYVHYDSRMKKA